MDRILRIRNMQKMLTQKLHLAIYYVKALMYVDRKLKIIITGAKYYSLKIYR